MPLDRPLKIAMIASECVPFAKSGGLADVVGALPSALQALGHEVIVILPSYSSINWEKHAVNLYWDNMGVWMGNGQEWCAVNYSYKPGFAVYLIEHQRYFDRSGLYHDAAYNDYADNPYRFSFLTRAGLQLLRDLDFRADIVHVHDWQTALAPAYLKKWHWNDRVLGGAASVLTIHNAAYQGRYSADCWSYVGLGWDLFHGGAFEDHGATNFLKGGIVFADVVNTVSPTYANEIRTAELGYGMAPWLNEKGDSFWGIVNGVDYDEWNPAVDTLLPELYTPGDLAGKAANKAELQRRMDLEVNPEVPIIGVVSRFAAQKGLHLLAEAIEGIVNTMEVQFAILGSGDPDLQWRFGELPGRYGGRIGSYIGYDNNLAHLIEAGSDFFLMPSIYEPCGLNQIYSLKYGTLPIVRATGGLQDTVIQYDEATGGGTGFKFWTADAHSLYNTVGWAVSTWYDRPEHIAQMRQRAMTQDYSWRRSAEGYEWLYKRAMQNRSPS